MTYGETPLRTFSIVLKAAVAKSDLSFLELGSGTGRLSLMAAKAWDLQVLGVEMVQPFVERANVIARRAGNLPEGYIGPLLIQLANQ